jgi:LysR family glycine cleavage system transcriptional activator
MSLPPLAAVRCFEAVARHASFTRAAEELGMTQAAVSYQIRVLEDRLGPLFLRRPRGVELTEAGRRLAPAVTGAFDDLRAAFAEVDPAAAGTLVVSAINTFASNWLVPRLGAFRDAHPGIAVRLEVTGRLVDFAREEVDVGIRTGEARTGDGPWPGLVAHRLRAVDYAPVLGPRLLAAAGPVAAPADLLRLPLIDPHDPWWARWFRAAGVEPGDLAARPDLRVGTQPLGAGAAIAGQGVAILTPAFFRDDLAAGRLVQPFPGLRDPTAAYWLVYPEARRRSRKVAAFRDWLLDAVARDGDEG